MALEAAVRRTKLGSQRVRPRANTGAYDSALRRQPKRSQPFACSGTSGASGGPGWPQRGTRPPVVLASRARGPAARRVPATGLAPVRWQRGLYEIPPELDVFDEANWRLANPAIDVFRSREDMRLLAERARYMPALEASF